MKSISKRAPLRLDVSYAEKDHVPLILTTTATSPDSALVTSSCSGVCKLPAPSAFRAQSHRFEASLITEDVYLGSFTDAMQRAALVEHGITHILNVAKEVDSEHSSSDDDTHTPPSTSFVFKKIAVNDNSDEDIGKYFQECLEFIQSARDQHGKVLVHCRQGVSRSPTIVIAHLVHDLGYTLEDAMAHVQNCRESVCPNIGFILTLEEYAHSIDRHCLRKTSSSRPQRLLPTVAPNLHLLRTHHHQQPQQDCTLLRVCSFVSFEGGDEAITPIQGGFTDFFPQNANFVPSSWNESLLGCSL
eukprot:PhF_6_TR28354/c0_g1_i1/m.42049